MKIKIVFCLSFVLLIASFATAQVPCTPNTIRSTALFVNWPQLGYDAGHTGCNPYESILSPNTAGNLALKWEYDVGYTGVSSSPVVANGIAYFGSFDKNLYAVNATTGVLLWKYQMPNLIFHAPAVPNGLLYVGPLNFDSPNFFALKASTGDLVWSREVGDTPGSSPTVLNGVVYVAVSAAVYALDGATGAKLWENFQLPSISSELVVANGMVYFGSDSMYAVKADTGELVWQKTLGDSVAPLAIARGVLYAGGKDNNVYALEASTGETLWKYPTGSVKTLAAVANGVVYVGANYSSLYALKADNGNFLWSYSIGEGISGGPIVANGMVYLGSYGSDSHLFAFHLPGH